MPCGPRSVLPKAGIKSRSPTTGKAAANRQFRDGLRMFARPDGAWLLAELVAKVTGLAAVQPAVHGKPTHICEQVQNAFAVLFLEDPPRRISFRPVELEHLGRFRLEPSRPG